MGGDDHSAPADVLFGNARHEGRDYGFEVTGARAFAIEVRFTSALPPDRVNLDRVDVSLGARPRQGEGAAAGPPSVAAPTEAIPLGRCKFEAHGDGLAGHIIPIDEPLKCRELLTRRRVVRVDQGFDQLGLLLARKDAIAPEFRAYTADLVYDVSLYRSLFDEVDRGLAGEPEEVRALVHRSTIASRGRAFMQLFDARLSALEDLVRGFSRQEHERHGFYFRRNVWDFVLASPFLARTNLRPRGYAGDSMTMQYLYENGYVGETLFGKLLHKHPVESHAAQAVRNRRRLLVESANAAWRERPDAGRRLRIMSVACGPAWEVRDLFAGAADCERFECTLLDQDEEALGEAEAAIAAVSARIGAPVGVRYLRNSVRTMLSTRDLSQRFGRHDFVYSMGLFDYLTTPVARTVLQKLYQLVAPGGRMIIGNFHVGNPTRVYMEYWMDWALLYRTEDELAAMARELPGATHRVYFEDTRSQMFLEVHKPVSSQSGA